MPDYLAHLNLTDFEFELLSGNAFSVKLYRQKIRYPIGAMVIIPDGNIMFAESSVAEAWVWIYSPRANVPLKSEIVFQFLKPCDIMLTENEKKALQKEMGIKITGIINSKFTDR